ncbi:putative uncharacterized protein DDB_G0282133 [Saccostrea echinata]|uniref:putative uncharacterized protein DDB_G0282133 n=1 Tax=Saccostrea echinata TaxID=191078 RepID=UPI002A82DCF2|nr:putative uncharacterized protein DDB_G0282133 [Saccostrea echinata]
MFAFVVFATALTAVNAVPRHIGETPLTKALSTNNSTLIENTGNTETPRESHLSTLEEKDEVKIPLDQKLRHTIGVINKLTERLPMEKKKNFTKSFINLFLKLKDPDHTLSAAKSAALKNIVKSKTREAKQDNNGTTAGYTVVVLNTDNAENSTQSQTSILSDMKTNETPIHQSSHVMNKDIKGKHRRADSRVASPNQPLLFEFDEEVQRERIDQNENEDDDDDDDDDDEDQDTDNTRNDIRILERQLNSFPSETLFAGDSLFGIQQREPIQQSRVVQQRRPNRQIQTSNTWQQRQQIFPNTVIASSVERTPNVNTIRNFKAITDPEQEIKTLEKFLNFAEGFAQVGNERIPSIQDENDLFEAFNDENSFLNRLQDNFENFNEHDQESKEDNAFQRSSPARDVSLRNTPNDGKRPAIIGINDNRKLQTEDSNEDTRNEIVKFLQNDIRRFQSGDFQSDENDDLRENIISNHKHEQDSKEEGESLPGIRNVFRISERDRHTPNLIAAIIRDNKNPDVNFLRLNDDRQMQKEDSDEETESKIIGNGNEIHIFQNRDSQSYEYDDSNEQHIMGGRDQIRGESKDASKGRNSGNAESASSYSNSASNEENSREENSGKKSDGSFENSRKSKSKSSSSEQGSSDEKSGESNSGSSDSDSKSSKQDSSGENSGSADKSYSKSNSRSSEHDSSKDSGSSGSKSNSYEQDSKSSESSEDSNSNENSEQGNKSSKESSEDSNSNENSESKSSKESSEDSKSNENSKSKSSEESSEDSNSSENKSSEESSESKELPQQINPQRQPPVINNDLPLNNPRVEKLYIPAKPKDQKIFGKEPEPEPPRETYENWEFLDDHNFGNLNLDQPINDDQDLLNAIIEIEKKNYGIQEMKTDSSEYSDERDYYKPKQYKGYSKYSDDRKIYRNQRKYSGYSTYRPKYKQSKYAGDKLKLTDRELAELNLIYRATRGYRPTRFAKTWATHHFPVFVGRNRHLNSQVRAYILREIENSNRRTFNRRGRMGRRRYGRLNRRGILPIRQPYGRFGIRRGVMRNTLPLFENRDYYYPNIHIGR